MKRRREPPAYVAHPCVVLAIDPGTTSGWAVFLHGRYIASGVARTLQERSAAIAKALEVAGADMQIVVVGEKWPTGGRFGGHRTQSGLSEQWGIWRALLEAVVAKKRILRVLPATWWAALGLHSRMGHSALKRATRFRAALVTGREFETFPEDEADAIAIGTWAVRAADVGAALTKPRTPRPLRKKPSPQGAAA